jgi:hypothetical protein
MGNDKYVVLSHKLHGYQGHAGRYVVVMEEQCGTAHVQIFCSDLQANYITDSQRRLRAHGLHSDGSSLMSSHFFFQQFMSFCWCFVALDVRHLRRT